MVNHPKISVIVPCYNQAKYLPSALNSVYNQSFNNWECLIINDGSTDNTEEVAHKWTQKDRRFKYFESENFGVSTARNLGIENSKGELIQFLDADDFLLPDKFKVSINNFGSLKTEGVVITNFKMYHEGLKQELPAYCKLKKEDFNFHQILFNWEKDFTIPIYCGLFSSSFFKDFRFPQDLKVKEDWVMWLHIFFKNPKLYFVDKPLGVSRKHKQSATMSSSHVEDQITVLDHVKNLLSAKEYELLLKTLIKKHYERSIYFKSQYLKLKNKKILRMEKFLKRVSTFLAFSKLV